MSTNKGGLVNLTPQFVDAAIKAFVPNLCCEVNPVAVILKQHICQLCFKKLKEEYTGSEWDIR